jgi:isopenicillin-N epimerase
MKEDAAPSLPLWSLDPAISFLNHGSFGACPRAVLAAQQRIAMELEREPVLFFRQLEPRLAAARRELAAFVGAPEEGLAFVTNATTGVNTVLRSIDWRPGDELLTTNHAYNACRNTLDFVAGRSGAKTVVASVPFPIDSPDRVVACLLERVTTSTRLALIDHVTSPTGLVFPIERIVRELADRGVDTLVDGAHAPGMLPLDVAAIGAAYYTGNLHKWVCAPKGAAFLSVRADKQAAVRPLVISHGANCERRDRSRYALEFDWTGTQDPSAFLAVPAAIAFMGAQLPGGWPALMEANRRKALAARALLCEKLDVAPPAPESMIGTLAAVPLPDGSAGYRPPLYLDAWQEALFDRYRIEVPIVPFPRPPKRFVRISAQLYNAPAEYEKLAEALLELAGRA